ncbi:MAG: acyl-phosphate glycerol 3-phosphate acyltransferase [Rhodospirillaceae bacterium]|nr:acyl-phosphate glycerol 3-phosphate acyltransferase [Rhodospirillaceae bacterium]
MIDPISWEFSWPYILTAFIGGYSIGSVPFGLIFTQMSGIGDIRDIGSGNIGATNVLRTGKKGIAAATLTADILKGACAALIGMQFGPDIAVVAALGAFLGHLFPIWLKFRGGKGVATAVGIILALSWQVGLIALAVWLLAAALLRYSSLAALLGAVAAPLAAWWFATPQLVELYAVISILIWIKHYQNIKRLLTGQESKIGAKADTYSANDGGC